MSGPTRIGQGPWARLFATAIVPDEGSTLAERARQLVRESGVRSVEVAPGRIAGVVVGESGLEHEVTLTAARVPPRIWAAMKSFSRNNRPLEAAIEGKEQSVHLEHLMTVDWEQPLVPRPGGVSRSCSCEAGAGGIACEHVAAVGFAVAELIDREPGTLLMWRGCFEPAMVRDEAPEETPGSADVWLAGDLPSRIPPRPLPVGAVLKRLGPAGIRVGGDDLTAVLQPAYAAFAAPPRR